MSVLRGKFEMAVIKNIDGLKQLLNAGQTLEKMNTGVSSISQTGVNSDDGWARFERILGGINDLLEKATQYKNAQGSAAQPDTMQKPVYQSPPDYSPARTLGKQAKNAQNSQNNEVEKVMKQLFEFFVNHINECQKENPNMTIGEAIDKLPVNVTQLAVLLQMYIKSKGG